MTSYIQVIIRIIPLSNHNKIAIVQTQFPAPGRRRLKSCGKFPVSRAFLASDTSRNDAAVPKRYCPENYQPDRS